MTLNEVTDSWREFLIGLGARLRAVRTAKNITLDQAAKYLDLSAADVDAIESGSIDPEVTLVIEMSQFYSVTTAELLGETENSLNEAVS